MKRGLSRMNLGAAIAAVLMLAGIAGPARGQHPSQAQTNAVRQACRGDYQSYCSSVPGGGQAALACLQQNAASLSPSCQQAVGAASGSSAQSGPPPAGGRTEMSPREEMALMRQACGADYRTYCRGVRPGEGRAIACLRDNAASLSPGCQRMLMSASHNR